MANVKDKIRVIVLLFPPHPAALEHNYCQSSQWSVSPWRLSVGTDQSSHSPPSYWGCSPAGCEPRRWERLQHQGWCWWDSGSCSGCSWPASVSWSLCFLTLQRKWESVCEQARWTLWRRFICSIDFNRWCFCHFNPRNYDIWTLEIKPCRNTAFPFSLVVRLFNQIINKWMNK